MPIHRPAACGPASVCDTEKRFELVIPIEAPANNKSTTSRLAGAAAQPDKKSPVQVKPRNTNVVRMRVGVAPVEIQRSERRQQVRHDNADITNVAPPTRAMPPKKKCRSLTR